MQTENRLHKELLLRKGHCNYFNNWTTSEKAGLWAYSVQNRPL